MFDFESAQGAPLVAATIILIAVLLHLGIAFAFSGSVQF